MRHEDYVEKSANHYTKQWSSELDFKTFAKVVPRWSRSCPRAGFHGGNCSIASALRHPPNAVLRRGDITRPVDGGGPFDFIICRAAIHHTPDPTLTYRALASQVAPAATLAITAYAKKSAHARSNR